MFTIYDGRKEFYQWDLNRKLIVDDETIEQVHFSNKTDDCSSVCLVYKQDGKNVVDVPNILLQESWRINVYGYDKDYTKYSEIFNVVPRTKPDNYVYTETEVLNYNTLLDKINKVDENIGASVEDYMQKHPVEVDLSNYYTKAEVDAAIPEVDLSGYALKTEIPTVPTNVSEFNNDAGYLTEHQDLSSYALKTEIPDVSGLAKQEDLTALSENLSNNYYTKSEVDAAIPNVSGFITEIPAEYVTETELDAKGYLTEHQSLEGYAKTSDIPDVSGFTTMSAVEAKGYQTEAQVNALIQAAMPPSGDGVSY